MPYKFFRSVATLGLASLTLVAAYPNIGLAVEVPAAQIWTELPDPGHIAKVQTMPDFVELAAKLSPAVVNISTEEPADKPAEGDEPVLPGPHGKGNPLEDFGGPGGPGGGGGREHSRSLGSGFIISKDGYVLTNEHVVENPGKVTVTTQDGHNYVAKVIGHDSKSDVALLKIEPKHDLPVAPLGNSDGLKVGEWVMAIGNPFGFDHSVTVGIVSAKGRFIPGNFDDFIQTDASINPGNSGGPLIDQRGQVIGVNSAIYTQTGSSMGIGFAIPVNMVKEELAQLKSSGKVTRGWLGVLIQRMTPELAESLGLEDSRGALVAEVLKDGPAKIAGVKQGDVIVSFDNQPINDSRELPLVVGRTPLGHKGTLKVVRDKQTIELPVTITESKEAQVLASAGKPKPDIGAASQFGLRVKDLSPELARELGMDQQAGVVISSVQPGSRADEAGLRARDVILEVNRETVKNVDSYQGALKSGGKAKIVMLLFKRGDNTLYVALK